MLVIHSSGSFIHCKMCHGRVKTRLKFREDWWLALTWIRRGPPQTDSALALRLPPPTVNSMHITPDHQHPGGSNGLLAPGSNEMLRLVTKDRMNKMRACATVREIARKTAGSS